TQGHLENLVGYVVSQPVHHRLGVPPACWQGSCFQDLVGARTVKRFDPRAIRRDLPRLTEADIWRAAGLRTLAPLPAEQLEHFGPPEIIRAAAGVYLTSIELRGRTPEVIAARALALGMLHLVGI